MVQTILAIWGRETVTGLMSKNLGTIALDLHSEGAGFESRLVHRSSRLRFFVLFLSPFRLVAGYLSKEF
jgi:hypothetical protein